MIHAKCRTCGDDRYPGCPDCDYALTGPHTKRARNYDPPLTLRQKLGIVFGVLFVFVTLALAYCLLP